MTNTKLTPIGRLLHRDHPSPPVQLPIPLEKFNDPTFIPRLSFRYSPRHATDFADLATSLARHRDHALFIDTNMVNAPSVWWEALLSEPDRVYVTGRVLRELVPYLQRNTEHPLGPALFGRSAAIVVRADPDADSPEQVSLDYYMYLLSRRRLELWRRVDEFEREHGREPSAFELDAIRMEFQRWAGERLLRLSLKPIGPRQTDEALVLHAVAHAIRTGQRTKIISADLDVEDQFHTMVRLLTGHYFAMLLGRIYANDFAAMHPKVVPVHVLARHENLFEQHGAAVIDLGNKGIHGYIPRHATFVPISCMTVGAEYTSELTYGAETAMAEVLKVKEATGGMSTDRPGHPIDRGDVIETRDGRCRLGPAPAKDLALGGPRLYEAIQPHCLRVVQTLLQTTWSVPACADTVC